MYKEFFTMIRTNIKFDVRDRHDGGSISVDRRIVDAVDVMRGERQIKWRARMGVSM
jgi:hypothetical protein